MQIAIVMSRVPDLFYLEALNVSIKQYGETLVFNFHSASTHPDHCPQLRDVQDVGFSLGPARQNKYIGSFCMIFDLPHIDRESRIVTVAHATLASAIIGRLVMPR
jgi:hypothetical protein